MQHVTERERIVAVEMCRADGYEPYESVRVQIEGPRSIHDMADGPTERWRLYLRDARMFIAGMRGIAMDAN